MSRPRKWTQTRQGLLPTTNYEKYEGAIYLMPGCGLDTKTFEKYTDKWRYEGWRYERQPRIGLQMPQINGYECPISFLLVVDALMRTDPKAEIYASTFTDLLRGEFPHIIWDSQTVGRLLSRVAELSMESRSHRARHPQGVEPAQFLVREEVSGLYRYILFAGAGNQLWAGTVREFMSRWVAKWLIEIADDAQRGRYRRTRPTYSRGDWFEELRTAPWGRFEPDWLPTQPGV